MSVVVRIDVKDLCTGGRSGWKERWVDCEGVGSGGGSVGMLESRRGLSGSVVPRSGAGRAGVGPDIAHGQVITDAFDTEVATGIAGSLFSHLDGGGYRSVHLLLGRIEA